MLDYIIRNTKLPGKSGTFDLGINGGLFVEISESLQAIGHREFDAKGYLTTPPFVDSHFHMDATLSLGLPRLNHSGTLLEGIQIWGELKPELTAEALKSRALELLNWSVAKGTLAIRTHVDVTDPSLLAVDVLSQRGDEGLGGYPDCGVPAGWSVALRWR